MATVLAAKNMFDFHTMHFSVDKTVCIIVQSMAGSSEPTSPILVASLGQTFPNTLLATTGFQLQVAANEIEMEWPGVGHLRVVHRMDVEEAVAATWHRYDFDWTSFQPSELRDIFQLDGAHWYGAAQVRRQLWPIDRWSFRQTPFIAGDSFKDGQFGGVQERYFLSSAGVAIYIDETVPLWVAINGAGDRLLKLAARFSSPYRAPAAAATTRPFLRYSIYQSRDVRTVHDVICDAVIARPNAIPDERMFRHPIWSTWAMFKRDIDQARVVQFAREIRRQGFEAAQLEIDDDWTPAYGDMDFDTRKFPDPQAMINDLSFLGFRVTLWVHPFASPQSAAVRRGDFWVRSKLTRGMTKWWNGIARCLDVTNPAAVAWFRSCLLDLIEKYGVTSYKFDAGELSWLPPMYSLHADDVRTPNEYTRLYAEMCASVDQDLRALEVRVGVRTQNLPIFVRMMDKDTRWDDENGLATLIPHALTFGIIGYPFVLPDMVGGNAYNGLPDRELYVRWFEATALLPAIQISIPPWQYDDEVVRIARKMLRLRQNYADVIVRLAHESTRTGAPIIRPLWWVAPCDPIAQVVDSEFLLGEDLLVAPVLHSGAMSRRVYLPAGRWRCELTFAELEGAQWIDCSAPLDALPHFTRLLVANATITVAADLGETTNDESGSFEELSAPCHN